MTCRVVFSLVEEHIVPRQRRGCRLLVFCEKVALEILPFICNCELIKLCDYVVQFAYASFMVWVFLAF